MKLTKLFFVFTFLLGLSLSSGGQVNPSDYISSPIDRVATDQRIVGKVVGVHDGDTITVLDAENNQYKIRLNGIDAPELTQDFGRKSKENLSDLVFGKEVIVIYNKTDKYKRIVGTVWIKGTDANLKQIEAGLAWHYKKYQSEQLEADRKIYSNAEIKARDAKLGLWVQSNSIPPWDYRASKKTSAVSKSDDVRQPNNSSRTRTYIRGPRGGCYYINSNGNKTYVDRGKCN